MLELLLYHKRNSLTMTVAYGMLHYNDKIIINTEKQRSSTDEKLFGLLRIENDFPKYFAKCHNLFRSFFCRTLQ